MTPSDLEKALDNAIEVLEQLPVHVTLDGVWLNFRPNVKDDMGGAMIAVTDPKVQEVIKDRKARWDKARSDLQGIRQALSTALTRKGEYFVGVAKGKLHDDFCANPMLSTLSHLETIGWAVDKIAEYGIVPALTPRPAEVEEQEPHWFCSHCQAEKSPVQVTYEENCTLCGNPVDWIETPAKQTAQEIEGSDWKEITELYNQHLIENDHAPIDGTERLSLHCLLDFLASQGRLYAAQTQDSGRNEGMLTCISDLAQYIEMEGMVEQDNVTELLAKHKDLIDRAYGQENAKIDNTDLEKALADTPTTKPVKGGE